MKPKQVRKIKEGLRFTNATFAKKMGVTQHSIWAWMAGIKKPRPSNVIKLEKLFSKLK